MSFRQQLWKRRTALCLGLLALSITLGLGAVAGFSLNLLITSAMGVSLIVPTFGSCSARLEDAFWLLIASVVGVLGGWLIVEQGLLVKGAQLLLCAAIYAGVVWAQISLCRLMVAWRIDAVIAGAVVTVLSLTWLAWPLWTTTAPPLCVRLHPLLAMNGVVSEGLGIWTEQPIAYPWIALGQDVSYRLPASPWPSLALHAGIGVLANLLSPCWRRDHQRTNQGERRPASAAD